jgi:hypothetical protein
VNAFRLARIRTGEWIVGLSALLLLIDLFALPWYGFNSVFRGTAAILGEPVSASGWQMLEVIRLLVVLVCLGGIAVWWLQATRPAPALPVSATVLDLALAVPVFVLLFNRVLLNTPGDPTFISAQSGAYIGLVLAGGLCVGGWLSLREDGIAEEDAPRDIEMLRLARPGARHS